MPGYITPATGSGTAIGDTRSIPEVPLVATDIDGHREFAFDGQTALTSPARSPERLAENVNRLLEDPKLRIELANKGHEFVRTLTWERATNSMEWALYSEADSLLELSAHG